MLRMNLVNREQIERFVVKNKKGDDIQLEIFRKEGNIYIGPSTMLFHELFKDTHRIRFESMLDPYGRELLHLSTIFKYLNIYEEYCNITKEELVNKLKEKGVDLNDTTIKNKTYSASKQLSVKFGFSDMTFTEDIKGNIWVFMRKFEFKKLKNEIINNIPKHKINDFIKEYKKLVRYIRYIDTDSIQEDGRVRAFALKSINITELYNWLEDNKCLHLVSYVADLYNECAREIEFDNSFPIEGYYKIISTEEGLFIKNKEKVNI